MPGFFKVEESGVMKQLITYTLVELSCDAHRACWTLDLESLPTLNLGAEQSRIGRCHHSEARLNDLAKKEFRTDAVQHT